MKLEITILFLLSCYLPMQAKLALPDSTTNNDIETVVVTATKTPKHLKDCPVITRVITSQEIQKADVADVQELLTQTIPGLEFSKAFNGETVLNFQGVGGNKVLFLIDGNRIAGETMDNPDYSRLNLDHVERIEIVKGAASTLYGSQAMGAVINIITKTPQKNFTAHLDYHIASQQTQRHGALIGIKRKHFSWMTSGQYKQNGAYKFPESKDFYAPNELTGIEKNRSFNVNQDIQWYIHPRITLRGHFGFYQRTRFVNADEHKKYFDYSAYLNGAFKLKNDAALEVTGVYDQYRKGTDDRINKKYHHNYTNEQHSVRMLLNKTLINGDKITLGGDFLRDYLMSYQFHDNRDYNEYAFDAFAQYDKDITPQLNFIGALRYDYFTNRHSQRATPKIGLMYKLDNARFRASYAAGFRSPTLKETYMNFNMPGGDFMIYGNAKLRPETSNNFQLSADYFKRKFNATLIASYNIVNNRISTVEIDTLGEKAQQYNNIKKIRIFTLEAGYTQQFKGGFKAQFSYVFNHELDNGSNDQGVKFTATRPHSAICRIDYAHQWKNYDLNIGLNGRFLSGMNIPVYNTNGEAIRDLWGNIQKSHYSAYQLWDFSVLQRVKKAYSLILRVNNIFNYRPHPYRLNSPLTTGTTFSAGITIDFDKI